LLHINSRDTKDVPESNPVYFSSIKKHKLLPKSVISLPDILCIASNGILINECVGYKFKLLSRNLLEGIKKHEKPKSGHPISWPGLDPRTSRIEYMC
jgi:hypothetical protein